MSDPQVPHGTGPASVDARGWRVLVTGTSGHLGGALAARLEALGATVVGLDPLPGAHTSVLGSAADGELVQRTLQHHGITAIVHAGALHKPQVATHTRRAFLEQNVLATHHLLEAATSGGSTVDRFVFTSTTSLMIDRTLRASLTEGAERAAWLTEDHAPLRPRNIYGVSKLAAEELVRLHHELHGLPCTVLRTARFFPEEDDQAPHIAQHGLNTKANELLFRRATLDDMVHAHLLALQRGPALGFERFLVSAPSPFAEDDCPGLMKDAPAVVARHHPRFEALYARLGWSMFPRIDRVYVTHKAERLLGFRARTDFARLLDGIERGEDLAALVGHRPGYRAVSQVPRAL